MIAVKSEYNGPGLVLASLLTGYPDEAFIQNVSVLLEDATLSSTLGDLRGRVTDLLGSGDRLDDLRSE
mgnify:CR=1 FL=1